MAIRTLTATVLGLLAIVGSPHVAADPFTPAEQRFLGDVKPNLRGNGDARASAMSDQQLVDTGWQACHYRGIGQSPQRYGISPVIGTYAYSDLCP